MTTLMLGVGDFGASNAPGDIIKTMALGSCVSVVFFHRASKAAGMVHVALPDSSISPQRAKTRPGYFADTGIAALFKAMNRFTGFNQGRDVVVKLVGGARVMDPKGTFNIGKRNVLAVKKILWQRGLGPVAEDVGGVISRTVTVEVGLEKVVIHSAGRGMWEI
jgi:chemotaxis protein CheD